MAGAQVSPFAAGCAVRGTDLQAARAELAAKRARRPPLPGAARPGDDAIRVGVGVVTAGFARDGRVRPVTAVFAP